MYRSLGLRFPNRWIYRPVGGSELHGAKVHGTDDLDIYGIYVEPPSSSLQCAYQEMWSAS